MAQKTDLKNGQPEACYRLIYRSKSLLPERTAGGEEALASLLSEARKNNSSRGITGALVLYEYKNRFAQVLEGPEPEIKSLFDKIQKDTRHDSVKVVESSVVPAREFTHWAMTLVVEHGEDDIPLMASTGGLSEAAPWRVTPGQEVVLSKLRDLTRSYGRAY